MLMPILKHGYSKLNEKRPLFFLVGLVSALSFTLSAFEYKSFYDIEQIVDETEYLDDEYDQDMIAITIMKVPEIPQPKPKPQPVPSIEPAPAPDPMIDEPIEPVIDLSSDIPLIGMKDEKAIIDDPITPTVNYAEQPAEFIGGEIKLFEYLGNELDFQKFHLSESFTVLVSFVIDEHGNPTQVEILRGIHSGVDKMILDVIESMPNWKPAKQGGETVRQRFVLPVKYDLK